MKKAHWIALIALLVWCSYLTIELSTVRKNNLQGRQEVNQITLNGYTTNLTEVVSKTESKVVGIMGYDFDQKINLGTGVIYEVEGNTIYIATNYHVIEKEDKLSILFHSGAELSATLVGFDPFSDLALLKVEAEFKAEAFSFGNSAILKKGEYVLGIGNPMNENFFGTVTFGIISGKNRSFLLDINEDGRADGELLFLQTDAAINPGNSGGALINLNGDLVGMTMLKAATPDSEGINFALGINEMLPILKQLKENGSVHRVILGIQGMNISELTIYQKGYQGISLDLLEGVVISKVFNDGPAKDMGVLPGDILLSMNDIEIKSVQDIRNFLYQAEPGSLSIRVRRAGEERILQGEIR